jgi:hypothetical protein
MSDDLMRQLETTLYHYAIDLEYWTPYFDSIFDAWRNRLFLQEHLSNLTETQKKQLHEIDGRILELISAGYNEVPEEDASSLKLLSDVIQGIERPPEYYPEFERNFSKYRIRLSDRFSYLDV